MRALGVKVEIDSVGWDQPDGGDGHAPAEEPQPTLSKLFVTKLFFLNLPRTWLSKQTTLELLQTIQCYEVNDAEDEDDEEEGGADELPADSPEDAWSGPDHLLHIIAEPGDSVVPEHSDGLNKDDKQDRVGGAEHVEHGHQVLASLTLQHDMINIVTVNTHVGAGW